MRRGDIVDVQLPRPGRIGGHEQAGKRPAIVVQDEDNRLPTILVVPLTGRKRACKFPHTVLVPPTTKNGLDCDSVALVFQVRAIDTNRILKQRGKLEDDALADVTLALKSLLHI